MCPEKAVKPQWLRCHCICPNLILYFIKQLMSDCREKRTTLKKDGVGLYIIQFGVLVYLAYR